LGDGTTNKHDTPMPVDLGRVYTEVAAGESHVCAMTAIAGTYCWGWNYYGQLGDNTLSQQLLPTAVYGNPTYEHIGGGSYQSCGISAGLAYCWGRNNYGQVGDNTTANRLTPTPITQLFFKW
jgi:alpha-tubulin suppressor-like RCC1 family protein